MPFKPLRLFGYPQGMEQDRTRCPGGGAWVRRGGRPAAGFGLVLARVGAAPSVLALSGLVLSGFAASAWAAPQPRGPRTGVPCGTMAAGSAAAGPSTAMAAGWSDAGALVLADGRILVPEGIALPTRLDPDAERLATAAQATEVALAGCAVAATSAGRDRHGRLAGPAVLSCPREAGERREDLAAALLRAGAGLARAEGEEACIEARLAAEDEARTARRGIWSRPDAVVSAADPAAFAIRAGLFTVAEGRVLAAGGGDRLFLNFGSSWKQDFTVMIAREDFATMLGDSREAATLRGALVRVRGIVREEGGPAMVLRRRGEMARLEESRRSPVRRREP